MACLDFLKKPPFPKKKLSKETKKEIIAACIDEKLARQESKEDYDLQVKLMNRVFTALENGEALSVQLFTDFQTIASENSPEEPPIPSDSYYTAPEITPFSFGSSEKGFRKTKVTRPGSTLDKGTLTKEGLKEILALMADEQKQGYPKHEGTVLAPREMNRLLWNDKRTLHCGSLPADWQEEKRLNELWEDFQKQDYSIIWPRTSREDLSTTDYVFNTFINMVKDFIREEPNYKGEDKKQFILRFIKAAILFHPYAGCHHRVFVLGGLNFLLLRYFDAYCPLKDRRQFKLKGINELLEAVNKDLKPLKTQKPEPSDLKAPLLDNTANNSASCSNCLVM